MIEQIAIGLTGVVAIFLTQCESLAWRRYACLFGLVGQPAWFYATWKAGQWGIFGISFLYLFSWLLGFWRYWIRENDDDLPPA